MSAKEPNPCPKGQWKPPASPAPPRSFHPDMAPGTRGFEDAVAKSSPLNQIMRAAEIDPSTCTSFTITWNAETGLQVSLTRAVESAGMGGLRTKS